MFFVAAGMQKAGSAYFYNLTNDLLILEGFQDARAVKEKRGLEELMKWGNNNVGLLDRPTLLKLLRVSFSEGTFAIKTHQGPSRTLNLLMKLGLPKVVYIYRAPRDAYFSAVDHGKKLIQEKVEHGGFAQMLDFEEAQRRLKKWGANYALYKRNKQVLCVSYESLVQNPLSVLREVSAHLGLDLTEEALQKVLHKYLQDGEGNGPQGLHFNKAKVERYKEEMPPEKLKTFQDEFGETIRSMGYDL